MYSHLLFRLM